MPKLEILVGMIASGKSTYALKRAKEGAWIVAHDRLSEMAHGEYRYEQESREIYRDLENALACTLARAGKDIVVDRTHLTAEARSRWVEFARHLRVDRGIGGIEIVAVAFPIEAPALHAARRHRHDARGRSYETWLGVARHHYEQALAEPLGPGEGFSHLYYPGKDSPL